MNSVSVKSKDQLLSFSSELDVAHLFASRQIGDVLPTLFRWHDTELDTFRERIHAVNQFEFCISAQGDHLMQQTNISVQQLSGYRRLETYLVHLFQLATNGIETRHESFQARLAKVVVSLLGLISSCRDRLEISSSVEVFPFSSAPFGQNVQIGLRLASLLCKCTSE